MQWSDYHRGQCHEREVSVAESNGPLEELVGRLPRFQLNHHDPADQNDRDPTYKVHQSLAGMGMVIVMGMEMVMEMEMGMTTVEDSNEQ